jgi:hypothetical protein
MRGAKHGFAGLIRPAALEGAGCGAGMMPDGELRGRPAPGRR